MQQEFSHYPAIPVPFGLELPVSPEHPCAYLPNRLARSRVAWTEQLAGSQYVALMDAGFRRSGKLIYQPVCRGCRQCIQIRLDVNRFRPTRSQRRVALRNQDLAIELTPPESTPEKWALYRKYVTCWHGQAESDATEASFRSFLCDSPVPTTHVTYRDKVGKLVGVGVCDLPGNTLSSVYFFFDPDEAHRSPGTFAILREIELARSMGLQWYYLGFWVAESPKMSYKSSFGPHQLLGTDGIWRDAPPEAGRPME